MVENNRQQLEYEAFRKKKKKEKEKQKIKKTKKHMDQAQL
jgi:hypothetical protein